MFIRFQRCRGLKVFRFGRKQLELWFCPRGEVIPPHVHDNLDSKIIFLAGKMVFKGDVREIPLDWKRTGFSFTAKAGENHSAVITGPFGLFANLETWHSKPTSAADDFRHL